MSFGWLRPPGRSHSKDILDEAIFKSTQGHPLNLNDYYSMPEFTKLIDTLQ